MNDIGFVGYRSANLRAGLLTGILNPKTIRFHMAFLAQFMNPELPMAPQFQVLMAISCAVVFLILFGYALLAAQARHRIKSLRARKSKGYAGGVFLLGGSPLVASTR
ncbi:LysE family translocator [Roseovarius halotolerans]|nr:LysE family transporter [Roseovarius halotolerans]